VVVGCVGSWGQAVANTILKKYVVEKGSYSTKAARVVAVTGSLTQRDHSLEVVGSGRDEELFKTLTAIAGSGTLVHGGEDGSELYVLDKPGSERAFGRRSFEQLANHILPKLGTELYLYIESGDMAGLYDTDIPPPEYVATAFAARALHLKGEVLKARVGEASQPLLSLFMETLTVSSKTLKYYISTIPKKIDLKRRRHTLRCRGRGRGGGILKSDGSLGWLHMSRLGVVPDSIL